MNKRILLTATALVAAPLGAANAQVSVPAIQQDATPASNNNTHVMGPPIRPNVVLADDNNSPPPSAASPSVVVQRHPDPISPSTATNAAVVLERHPASISSPSKPPTEQVETQDQGSKGTPAVHPASGPPGLAQAQQGAQQPPQKVYPRHAPPTIDPVSHKPVALSPMEARSFSIARHWQHRASMPSTGEDGSSVWTFGTTQPSIVCSPLNVCLLRLEPGERVLPDGLQLGDKTRWMVTPTVAGGETMQTVIVIKPADAGLRTTMALMTDRRIYTIKLVSDQTRFVPLTSFTYPEEDKAKWEEYYQQQNAYREGRTLPDGMNIANLDFDFPITGDSPVWRPTRVYSDGVHTYIQFPDEIRSSDAPSLLALARDGTWFSDPTAQIVNYRREGNTYVVDKVLDRAELIVGVGDNQSRVVINHHHDQE